MERERRMPRWLRRSGRGAAAADAAAREREDLLLAAAEAGFPVAPAARPEAYGCSCERIGCPTPGRHPVSFAWQTQATTDRDTVLRWLASDPEANAVTATGQAHDVLDVPAEAGHAALERLAAAQVEVGPVAFADPDRMLFFTATRGTPEDEDEWWPCVLDCRPETMDEHPGLRWHCRGSYVLLPPARVPEGGVRWLPGHGPRQPLPDPLSLLETLTDACAEVVTEEDEEPQVHEPSSWSGR
ncbi:bifunctional DNA primase/polymerase [Streptomyces sodiiphilus]|uniref:Bifunctional DNA primase/polymerase n=1 Tax=Streptomyces sodiiphilus TaxID=226217 RepID=A0ABN2NR81_9ACTN